MTTGPAALLQGTLDLLIVDVLAIETSKWQTFARAIARLLGPA